MGSTSAGPSVASLVASQCLLKSGIAGIAIHHCSQIFFYKLLTLGHRFWCETSHESCPHGWVQYIPPIFGMRGSIHYPGRRSPCLNTAYFVGRTPGVSSSHIRIFVLARGPHWRMRQNFTPKLSSASKGGGLELRVAIFTIKRGAKKLLRVSQLDGQRTTHFSRYIAVIKSIVSTMTCLGYPSLTHSHVWEGLTNFCDNSWESSGEGITSSFFWFLPSEHHGHPSLGQNLINILLFTPSVWSCYFGRCSSPILRWTLIF